MRKLTRREFFRLGGGLAATATLAACAPQASPAPQVAPTTAPAAPAAEAPPAAAAEPAVAASKYKEAPMLAQLVQAGTLPAVDERVPAEPMVITPNEKVGQYGGT